MRLSKIILALAWGFSLAGNGQASAADGPEITAALAHDEPGPTSARTATTPPLPHGVVVSVGRGLDLVGRPKFPDRRAARGSISVVSLSDRPFVATPPSRAGSRGVLTLVGARIASGFGSRLHPVSGVWSRHAGVDLVLPAGTPVYASSGGRVTRAAWAGGYGLLVELDHGRGLQTRYAHLSRLAVGAGRLVAQGELIGYVGSTGRSTGPHLHYETRVNGAAVDPAHF